MLSWQYIIWVFYKAQLRLRFFLAPTSRLLQRAKRHALSYKEHSSHRLAAHAYNLAIPLYIQNC